MSPARRTCAVSPRPRPRHGARIGQGGELGRAGSAEGLGVVAGVVGEQRTGRRAVVAAHRAGELFGGRRRRGLRGRGASGGGRRSPVAAEGQRPEQCGPRRLLDHARGYPDGGRGNRGARKVRPATAGKTSAMEHPKGEYLDMDEDKRQQLDQQAEEYVDDVAEAPAMNAEPDRAPPRLRHGGARRQPRTDGILSPARRGARVRRRRRGTITRVPVRPLFRGALCAVVFAGAAALAVAGLPAAGQSVGMHAMARRLAAAAVPDAGPGSGCRPCWRLGGYGAAVVPIDARHPTPPARSIATPASCAAPSLQSGSGEFDVAAGSVRPPDPGRCTPCGSRSSAGCPSTGTGSPRSCWRPSTTPAAGATAARCRSRAPTARRPSPSVLASPDTSAALCGEIGTDGTLSCRNGPTRGAHLPPLGQRDRRVRRQPHRLPAVRGEPRGRARAGARPRALPGTGAAGTGDAAADAGPQGLHGELLAVSRPAGRHPDTPATAGRRRAAYARQA